MVDWVSKILKHLIWQCWPNIVGDEFNAKMFCVTVSLNQKYFPTCGFLDAGLGYNPSFVW
ncbi:hypothetical protein CRYUN_Cryun08bG0080400 [Craigia yunnanensis]